MAKFLPSRYLKVLEIGCGHGAFRHNLPQQCEYWGVEPNVEAAEVAGSRLHRVLVGTFSEVMAQFPDDYFDLVICNDVIEHMPDHDWFLDAIKRKIVNHGYLIGSVPNIRFIADMYHLLILKDWHYQDAGTLDRTHLRFFTLKSLNRTLLEHGYKIERLCGINTALANNKTWARVLLKLPIALVCILFYPLAWDAQYLQLGFRVRLDKA